MKELSDNIKKESDNMEIEVDKKLIAPELINDRFNTLVCLSISLMGGKLVTVGRHYQILE